MKLEIRKSKEERGEVEPTVEIWLEGQPNGDIYLYSRDIMRERIELEISLISDGTIRLFGKDKFECVPILSNFKKILIHP